MKHDIIVQTSTKFLSKFKVNLIFDEDSNEIRMLRPDEQPSEDAVTRTLKGSFNVDVARNEKKPVDERPICCKCKADML